MCCVVITRYVVYGYADALEQRQSLPIVSQVAVVIAVFDKIAQLYRKIVAAGGHPPYKCLCQWRRLLSELALYTPMKP